MTLLFEPEFELIFYDDKQVSLIISNQENDTVVCKIQTNKENCYTINPAYCFVASQQKVVATIKFEEEECNDDRSDHDINVQSWAFNEEHLPENAENYWKQNLKNNRRNIISKNFGVEFKDQPLKNDFNIETVTNDTLTIYEKSLTSNIESFVEYTIDSHNNIVELNTQFELLIEEMENAEVKEINEILESLREMAVTYKDLEHRTRAVVDQTNTAISNVAKVAGQKNLKPTDKLELIKNRFTSLDNQFEQLSERHTRISVQLGREADKAEAAKQRNDQRVEKAKEMKETAKVLGVLGTPVCGLITSIAGSTITAVDSVDNGGLKVLAGVGGTLRGVVVGAAVSIGSPILLTIAAVLAIKSKKWSVQFKSMHEMIGHLQEVMNKAASYLTDIHTNLDMLTNRVNGMNLNTSTAILNEEFIYIQQICVKITEKCQKYDRSTRNKTKALKQIDQPKYK